MKTCPNCYREHNGLGMFCAQCNNPKPIKGRQDRTQTSMQHAAHMEHADWLARNEDVGWPYDDDDDDDDDKD